MYSVIRFTSDEQLLRDDIKKLGENINKLIPDSYDGFHRGGSGFSSSVSKVDNWDNHKAEIFEFLSKIESLLSDACAKNIDITLDVAIHPEDVGNSILKSYFFNRQFLKLLATYKIELEVSLYCYGVEKELGTEAAGSK